MQRVCVYCGSNSGKRPEYLQMANTLGAELAQRQLTLVYGGAKVGLMGAVADATLAHGGKVIGVLPQALMTKELAHEGLTELHIVSSMHERKLMMAELSDAFIALPGGLGTLEELCEIATWTQLGLHRKPCGVLNVAGYYDGLIAFIQHAVQEGFIHEAQRSLILNATTPVELLALFEQVVLPAVPKWITQPQS
ncbi:TIGR00730 family Rossman fold protein [Thiofilum flexile]|uniref:LOG family protein n=1 Tax=Thiofilum flexile TaxID=125627 RepID=UPI000365B74C|nr:TIGR00730 family Rossman fold protein [Thiofilum flexile]